MAFEYKDKDQLVDDAINSIAEKNPDIDFSDGEPLRTFLEAVMNELDIQYWQIQQTYENSFIETGYGEDLSELVKILGITRLPATQSVGQVKFYRETPAAQDYTIPAGTLVESIPDNVGDTIQFETLQNVILLSGTTEIYADVQSVDAGANTNITAGRILVINDPPIGIESVINVESMTGGEDEETDDDLKVRAQSALEASGLGTINAIESKLISTPGVKSVNVIDMARGIGTMDILVLGETLPMSTTQKNELIAIVQGIKAGGIDFLITEPTVSNVNLNITLTLTSGTVLADVNTAVNEAINTYFSKLNIGDTLIRNQLAKDILNSSDGIIDITINTPSSNVTVSGTTIITLGTITLS
jgi:uncharacterized phage protein gp47/JayE